MNMEEIQTAIQKNTHHAHTLKDCNPFLFARMRLESKVN